MRTECRNIKKVVSLLAVMAMAAFLAGCSSTELESRNFPLVIAVDKADEGFEIAMGFQNLAEIADEKAKDGGTEPTSVMRTSWQKAFAAGDAENPKTMDYNHVKALILSREIFEDREMLGEFLEYMEQQEVFARNTLLFTSKGDAAELLELEGELELPIGTYLEELIANRKEIKSRAAVTLGSLLNEYRNKMENLYIPVLSEEKGKPQIAEYYVLCGCEGVGTVDRETYLLAMLLEGKLKQYELELDADTKAVRYGNAAVLLDNIHTQYSYSETEEGIFVQTSTTAEARLQNGRITTVEQQRQLKAALEKQLSGQADEAAKLHLWEKQLDITNSYYRLGGYHRGLYKAYQGDMPGYCNDLTLEISFEITPVLE